MHKGTFLPAFPLLLRSPSQTRSRSFFSASSLSLSRPGDEAPTTLVERRCLASSHTDVALSRVTSYLRGAETQGDELVARAEPRC